MHPRAPSTYPTRGGLGFDSAHDNDRTVKVLFVFLALTVDAAPCELGHRSAQHKSVVESSTVYRMCVCVLVRYRRALHLDIFKLPRASGGSETESRGYRFDLHNA